jgi:hypothetical protein
MICKKQLAGTFVPSAAFPEQERRRRMAEFDARMAQPGKTYPRPTQRDATWEHDRTVALTALAQVRKNLSWPKRSSGLNLAEEADAVVYCA